MKFCPECGTPVDGMKFCPECGCNLSEYINDVNNIQEPAVDDSENIFMPLIDVNYILGWKATYKIGKLKFDDLTKTFKYGGFLNNNIYKYETVKGYEVLENDSVVGKSGGFGIGRAITGGILFGGVGAVVGGVTKKGKTKSIIEQLRIKIELNDPQDPIVFVNVAKNIEAGSFAAKTARTDVDNITTALERLMSTGNAEAISESNLNIKLIERKEQIKIAEEKQKQREASFKEAQELKAKKEKAKQEKKDLISGLKSDLSNGLITKEEYKAQKKADKKKMKEEENAILALYKAKEITYREYLKKMKELHEKFI